MKVVHFAETLLGGPATHLNELLPFQVKKYDEVTVVCPESQKHSIKTPGVRVVTFPMSSRSPIELAKLWAFSQRFLENEQFDIIHLHSSLAGAVARLPPHRYSAPVVYCARGWSFAIHKDGLKKKLYELIERLLSRRTNAIINISYDEARLATEAGIPEVKCSTIYNGIADATWSPLPPETIARKLLFVGRYDRQKGIDVLVAAMEELHLEGFELTTIGGLVVSKPDTEKFPSYIKDRGWQTPQAIQLAMQEADAIVMPSRWEGFGFVAAEAMRAGRAVIASSVGGLKEIIVDGKTGLFCQPEDVYSLRSAVRSLRSHDVSQLGIAGRRRYEEKFTSQRMFNEIDDLYSNVLKGVA